jgi:DNA polymerase
MSQQRDILDEYLGVISFLKHYVEEQIELGFLEVPVSEQRKSEKETHQEDSPAVVYETMDEIRDAIVNCRKCPLHKTRKNVVFGEGNESAKLVFVGEAPGADEDRQGRPFVGRAGQKLTQIIEAMGLSRSDVFIANVLKCRPPDNRNPLPDEIKACEPYLIAQLKLIKPKIICALGTFSAQTLLRTDQRISSLRGRFYTYHSIKLMPTYHPAFILRNPKFKRDVWEDVQKIMAEYEK